MISHSLLMVQCLKRVAPIINPGCYSNWNMVIYPQKAELAIYFDLLECESTENRGIVEIDTHTGRSEFISDGIEVDR